MNVSELVKYLGSEVLAVNTKQFKLDVKQLSFNSNSVAEGSVFFAFKGASFDSHDVAMALFRSGTVSLVVAEYKLDSDIDHLVVKDGRVALSMASNLFFGEPLKKYKSVAITGTNGKTTTSYILDAIFKTDGASTVKIGTIGADVAGVSKPLDNTTPSSFDINEMLAGGLRAGAEFLSIEVSSHALAQGRIAGMKFNVAVFTNLSGDHLDYHKDIEDYFEAKSMLFKNSMSKHKVVNIDDEYGAKLAASIRDKNKLYTYAIDKKADVHATKYEFSIAGTYAELSILGKKIKRPLRSSLIGRHNLENMLAAISAAMLVGMDIDECLDGIAQLENIPGRLEKQANDKVTVFVDYAHTDDALINVIEAVRAVATKRIITVFGAGGDRDKTKRPRMAKAATSLSDVVIITSDNPRTEDPLAIIEDVKAGVVEGAEVIVEADREKAIAKAIEIAEQGDVVIVAGKGHEDYQIVGTVKHSFDDRLVVKKYL